MYFDSSPARFVGALFLLLIRPCKVMWLFPLCWFWISLRVMWFLVAISAVIWFSASHVVWGTPGAWLYQCEERDHSAGKFSYLRFDWCLVILITFVGDSLERLLVFDSVSSLTISNFSILIRCCDCIFDLDSNFGTDTMIWLWFLENWYYTLMLVVFIRYYTGFTVLIIIRNC